MSHHYWQGDLIQLRAIEDQDIAFFECVDDAFRWMAVNRDGLTVGTIDTFECNRRFGTFKYGILISEAHRRLGYAQEMIRMVLHYYYELGYQKVTPHVYSFNSASVKLHERMRFVKEGQLRSMLYTNGQYYDEIYYGMTKDEYIECYGDRN